MLEDLWIDHCIGYAVHISLRTTPIARMLDNCGDIGNGLIDKTFGK